VPHFKNKHPGADPTTFTERHPAVAASSQKVPVDEGESKRRHTGTGEKKTTPSTVKKMKKMKMKKKAGLHTDIPARKKLGQAVKRWKEAKGSEPPAPAAPETKKDDPPDPTEVPVEKPSHLVFCITCDRLIPAEKSAAHLPLGHDTVKIFDSRAGAGKAVKRPAEPKPVAAASTASDEPGDEEGRDDRVANRLEPLSSPEDSPHNSEVGQVRPFLVQIFY